MNLKQFTGEVCLFNSYSKFTLSTYFRPLDETAHFYYNKHDMRLNKILKNRGRKRVTETANRSQR